MEKIKSSTLPALQIIIGWPLTLIALFFLIKIIFTQGTPIAAHLDRLQLLPLLISIFCFIGFYSLRSLLWHIILKKQNYSLPLQESVLYWTISELKRFAPGNIWSFIGRSVSFAKLGIDKKIIAKSILIEIEFFLLGCIIVGLFSLPLLDYIFPNSASYATLKTLIVLLVTSIVVLYCFSSVLKFKSKFISFLLSALPNFTPWINIGLLSVSCISLVFFGTGYYFAINSLYFLTPINFWVYIGLFVLALLLGYASLITPMGLGVREGLITLGLSPILGAPQAGLGAILARVLLMLSEGLYLLIVFIWRKLEKKTGLIEKIIFRKTQELILGFSVTLYSVYFTTASFLRYDNFYTGRFDLGNMDQTVWNTIHGRIFTFTDPNGTETISRLSFHADFILILLSPLYLIWSDPRTLLLLQTVVLAAGAFFIFLIAQKVLQNKNLSLIFALAYLLNPALQYTNLYDFHAVTLATTLLLGAFYFLIQKKYVFLVMFAILASISKEQIWLITAFLGLYIAFINRAKVLGFALFVFSLTMIYLLIWHLIPNARGGEHFALEYYSEFGSSPTDIITNILSSPAKTLGFALQEDRLFYLHQLFSPLGYLPVFSYSLIFALPDLVINLLSNNANLHQIYYQYTATITPFLFIGGVYAIRRLQTLLPNVSLNIYIFYILISVFYSTYNFGPLPGAKNPNLDMFTKPLANKLTINTVIERIPKESKVATTNNLGSHLSQREHIYTLPTGAKKADYILFLLNESSSWSSSDTLKKLANSLRENKNFTVIVEKGDFLVFEKHSSVRTPL